MLVETVCSSPCWFCFATVRHPFSPSAALMIMGSWIIPLITPGSPQSGGESAAKPASCGRVLSSGAMEHLSSGTSFYPDSPSQLGETGQRLTPYSNRPGSNRWYWVFNLLTGA